jgi:ceramide glucosyltransferase
MSVALAGLYLFMLLARAALAVRHARMASRGASEVSCTIVQPILSGDPRLAPTLRRNLEAHPQAEFLWMIDDDDDEAHRIATGFAAHSNLRVISAPGPKDSENPKMAKLIRALPLINTPRLIVLDDDTFLPETSHLPAAQLVTGLPVFSAKGSIFERLIGGFVNGNALLTYLPAAHLKLQRTINGMIYSVETERLRDWGGFAAAGHALTDDYAVARLYLNHGVRIVQSAAPAFVEITVSSASSYVQIMRRWMIFATHYLRDNLTAATLFWIALPGLLPWIGIAAANSPGIALLWIGLLFAKAMLNRIMLWHIVGMRSSALDLLFEVASDLLTPVWMMLAFVQPSQLKWRSRRIEISNNEIRYR